MINPSYLDARIRTASGINSLAGLWLFLAPSALTYLISDGAAALSSMLAGASIFVLSIVRVSAPRRSPVLSAINFALGFWTLISPWVFGLTLKKAHHSCEVVKSETAKS